MIKVAVVGAGYWGKNLVRNFHALGVLNAICDSDMAHPHLAQYEGVERCTGFSDILKNKIITAVAIATPAEQHYIMVKEALLAGKHVFVEKPLCLNEREGVELNRLADEHNLVLMVGHLLQYHPAFLKLKALVSTGELGKIQYVYSNRLNLGKIRREENILWSFAPHDISMILALSGGMPEYVLTTGGNYLHEQIADVTLSSLAFKNGIKSHVFVSWLHPFKEQKLIVVGDKQMAVFDDVADIDEKLLLYPHKIDWKGGTVPVPVKEEAIRVTFEKKEPLLEECAHFVRCIETGQKPRTDGEEGLQVLLVLNALQRSLESHGKVVKIEPMQADIGCYIHETTVIDDPVEMGSGTQVWCFSHILKGSRIGNNCRIGQNVVIGPEVSVGNGCKIQNNVSVYKGVTLEEEVFCGPSMVFTNVYNPRAHLSKMHELKKTLVKRRVTIGANATIVAGVTIGAYAFIAAGAVVNRDVPSHALMVGVPAKRIGWVCECGERLDEDDQSLLKCGICEEHYRLNEFGLEKCE